MVLILSVLLHIPWPASAIAARMQGACNSNACVFKCVCVGAGNTWQRQIWNV